MFFQLLIVSLMVQVGAESAAFRDCKDAVPLAEATEKALIEGESLTLRLRELAIQSSNGAISVRDRGFLDDEFEAVHAELERILEHSAHIDRFLTIWHMLRDGYEIDVPLDLPGSWGRAYIRHFSLPGLPAKAMGQVYGSIVELNAAEELLGQAARFSINSVSMETNDMDDSLSISLNEHSSIALASVINSHLSQTGVRAQVLDTRLPWAPMSRLKREDLISQLSSLKYDELSINGVSIQGGSLSTTEDLMALINEYSSSTGIKANSDGLGLSPYALVGEDGRNISIQTKGSRKALIQEIFGMPSDRFTQLGAVRLESAKAFVLVNEQSGMSFEPGTLIRFDQVDQSLRTADISSQAGAQEAVGTVSVALQQILDRLMKNQELLALCAYRP